MRKMELRRQYISVFAICVSIILSAAIITYRPLMPKNGEEDFRFVTGIPNARGAVTATGVGYQPAVTIGDEQVKTISLSGYGSASGQANMATLTVGVQIERDEASDAIDENAALMTAVIEAIKSLDISEDDIKTVSYSVYPVYDWELKQVTGYRVTNLVQVRISDLDMVGEVIDAVSDAGANRIEGVSFGLSDDIAEQLKLDAYRDALKDAAEKAEVIAEALGLELTGVLSVSESVYYPYRAYAALEIAAPVPAPATTPIIEGTLSVSVTVQVVYTFQ